VLGIVCKNVIEMNMPCFAAGVVFIIFLVGINVRIKVQDKHELFRSGTFLAILLLVLHLSLMTSATVLSLMHNYLP
jgi:hypothetical protein